LNDLGRKIEDTGAKFEMELLPTIQGFPQLLSLLFYHLLDNAIKFRLKVDKRPLIKIEYAIVNTSNPNDELSENISYHKISIIDDGIGFSDEDAKKIFNMFYKVNKNGNYKGSGIGLSVCKKIMDIHSGFILAESSPSVGTAFQCFFIV
jgi:signal transduction histidine kinase